MKKIVMMMFLLAGSMLVPGDSEGAMFDCEVCHTTSGTCGGAFQSVCISWDDEHIGSGCDSWYEPLCQQMTALPSNDFDASGLEVGFADVADLVAQGPDEIVRKSCDNSVIAFAMTEERGADVRASTRVIDI